MQCPPNAKPGAGAAQSSAAALSRKCKKRAKQSAAPDAHPEGGPVALCSNNVIRVIGIGIAAAAGARLAAPSIFATAFAFKPFQLQAAGALYC